MNQLYLGLILVVELLWVMFKLLIVYLLIIKTVHSSSHLSYELDLQNSTLFPANGIKDTIFYPSGLVTLSGLPSCHKNIMLTTCKFETIIWQIFFSLILLMSFYFSPISVLISEYKMFPKLGSEISLGQDMLLAKTRFVSFF